MIKRLLDSQIDMNERLDQMEIVMSYHKDLINQQVKTFN